MQPSCEWYLSLKIKQSCSPVCVGESVTMFFLYYYEHSEILIQIRKTGKENIFCTRWPFIKMSLPIKVFIPGMVN